MNLDRSLRWLQHAIVGRRATSDLHPLSGSRVPVRLGLGIYRNAYRARLQECLADDFPALAGLLGKDAFARLAAQVIDQRPPCASTLNRYGRSLVAQLRNQPGCTAYGRLALDLARLEWAVVEAIHAPLADPISETDLAAIPPDRIGHLRLRAAPSLRRIASRWPIDVCLRQHLHGQPVSAPAPDPTMIAVLRRADGIVHRSFVPAGGCLIGRLARGLPLADALAGTRLDAAGVRQVLAGATAHGCFTTIVPEAA